MLLFPEVSFKQFFIFVYMNSAEGSIEDIIKQKAVELGFDACGISVATELKEYSAGLKQWLDNGYNAGMDYMANNFDKRLSPELLNPGTKSVISVLLNYYPENRQPDDTYYIAKYAYGKDYHNVIKAKLHKLAADINEITPINYRAFVDSAPVLERQWAVKSGLGWIGKHSLLINKEMGSFFFIGELLVDIDLKPDEKSVNNYCGNCTKCIDACPTGAIVSSGIIDAGLCLSYNTIENREDIDENIVTNINDRVFGCDICQDVCPWNRKVKPHNVLEFNPHDNLLSFTKHDWSSMDKSTFNEIFRKSAVKRAGYDKFMRTIKQVEDSPS